VNPMICRLLWIVALGTISWPVLATDVTGPEAKRTVALADLQRMTEKDPGDVTLQLSPDGRRLAIVHNNELLVLDVPSGRTLHNLGEGVVPAWSASAKQLAFYSARTGTLQLWVWNSATGNLKQITHLEHGIVVDLVTRGLGIRADALRFSWSPDETRIVFGLLIGVPGKDAAPQSDAGEMSTPLDPDAPLIATNATPLALAWRGIYAHDESMLGVGEIRDGRTLSFRQPKPHEILHTQLMIVDVRSGAVSQLTKGERSWFNPAWSPDGTTIACASSASETLWVDSTSDIMFIDVSSGTIRGGPGGPGFRYRPRWSPDGALLAYVGEKWLLDWPELYVVSTKEGAEPTQVPLLDRYISEYRWSNDGKGFLITYKDGTSTRLGWADLKLPGVREISAHSSFPLAVRQFSQSRSGLVAWNQFDPQDLSTVKYARADASASLRSKPTDLLKLSPEADALALGRVDFIAWKNSQGDDVEGSVLLPPQFSAGKRFPLIIDDYPHIGGSDWTNPMEGNFAWAAMGYVVFRPSPPTVHSRKIPWKTHASSLAPMGSEGIALMVDDVLSGVDELIRRGIVDSDRMCLYGFSAGGAVVSDLVTRTNRFKCAVAVAPAGTDWISPILTDPKFVLKGDWAGDLKFENDLGEFIAMSSVFHLADVRTPMLLADGDQTPDFLLGTLELYKGLRTHDKEVTLIRYPNQGHGFKGDAMKDFWGREMAFFAKYLRPD
jgi:dipeptidyl aminopeptidase/acylaminoacyl peptidase